jgi:hypothetical protein
MAFKMKGSPHKMGKIQGTSGHTSALKQKEAEASALKDTQYFGQNTSHDEVKSVTNHNKKHSAWEKSGGKKGWDENHEARKKELDKDRPDFKVGDDKPLPMKSPLEQKKKLNLETIKEGFKGTDTEKVVNAVKNVAGKVKKFRKSLKPRSETTVSREVTKGPTHKKGTDNEYSEDRVKVTASTKGSKKKLFGGKKETTSSSSRTHDQDTYKDGGVDRYHHDEFDGGVTTTTHSRNKRRGGGKKKVVTVDQNTGKKTVTRYKKDGSVKSTKVKKGDHSTYTPSAEKKALRDENKGK